MNSRANVDKIRVGAALAMHHAAAGEDYLAFAYCNWIKRHCEEILYEDMYYENLIRAEAEL